MNRKGRFYDRNFTFFKIAEKERTLPTQFSCLAEATYVVSNCEKFWNRFLSPSMFTKANRSKSRKMVLLKKAKKTTLEAESAFAYEFQKIFSSKVVCWGPKSGQNVTVFIEKYSSICLISDH